MAMGGKIAGFAEIVVGLAEDRMEKTIRDNRKWNPGEIWGKATRVINHLISDARERLLETLGFVKGETVPSILRPVLLGKQFLL